MKLQLAKEHNNDGKGIINERMSTFNGKVNRFNYSYNECSIERPESPGWEQILLEKIYLGAKN